MMNQPPVTWDDNSWAQTEGWVQAHCVNVTNAEYVGQMDVWVSAGTGLPAGAYLDEPPAKQADKAIVRSDEGWALVADYRGQTAYSKETRASQQITELGELPGTLTLLAPSSQFDVWDEALAAWIKDVAAESAWNLEQATAQRNSLLAEANKQIAVLADAVDFGLATEAEQAAHIEWRQYRVQLSRLDLTQPPIPWPSKPGAII